MNLPARLFQGALLGMITGPVLFLLYHAARPVQSEDQALVCALFSLAGALVGCVLGYLTFMRWRARSDSERAAWLDRLEENGRRS